MTNLEINQLLHERVMGECWHIRNRTTEEQSLAHVIWRKTDTTQPYPHLECIKCGMILDITEPINPSYTSSWASYGRLLEVAMTKEWWDDVAYGKALWQGFKVDTILNPLRGSTAMAEFVKERVI